VYHVAIVGSGPSGFYAAEALLSSPDVRVDMFDRLPTPFGLVRAGIAPDHQRTKQIVRSFERVATNPRFRFLGNVQIGRDVGIDRVQECYDATVLATGARSDRKLNVDGETLPGSLPATEFVGWYNGHPDFADLDVNLATKTAVIVGLGNVTADLCRILLGPIEHFERTDIAEHALSRLRVSNIETVHVVGRKGPGEARFTNPELRELGRVPGLEIKIDIGDLDRVDVASLGENSRKNVETFAAFASSRGEVGGKKLVFHFNKRPTRIVGTDRVVGIELEGDGTSRAEHIECGLVVRSIGNQNEPFDGLPFDDRRGVIANAGGRVVRDGHIIPGMYVTGWAKRGPSGTVGTNRNDSQETCRALRSDLDLRVPKPPGLVEGMLRQLEWAGISVVNYADWIEIDQQEVSRGQAVKPREKFVRIEEMLEISSSRASRSSRSQSLQGAGIWHCE
jgi:ferredoxin--NADP+ reductase